MEGNAPESVSELYHQTNTTINWREMLRHFRTTSAFEEMTERFPSSFRYRKPLRLIICGSPPYKNLLPWA